MKPNVRSLAERLPPWTGSIRFRLTLLYSAVLFALAAIVVAVIYLSLWRALQNEPVTQGLVTSRRTTQQGGFLVQEVRVTPFEFESVEQMVNEETLRTLRNYSFAALAGLFLTSLGVGWVVAGRVLRPIDQIAGVAREIQATDLSRRIDLQGPNDELKRLADTFDAMLARLDKAFEDQRRFIHDTSHELRNPLAVMRTNLDVFLRDPDPDPAEVKHTIEVMQRTIERMSRLTEDLLAYARRENRVEPRELLDVSQATREAVDEFELAAQEKTIALEVNAAAPLFLIGDREALKQALINLLSNALRHTPTGGRIGVATGQEGNWLWIAVDDSGPGIAEDDQAQVFERFWQAPDVDGRQDRSRSGLGLTIVKRIVESHGGSVSLFSEPGTGSTFVLWLPSAGARANAVGESVVPHSNPLSSL